MIRGALTGRVMKVHGAAQAVVSHGIGNQATAGVHEYEGTAEWRPHSPGAVRVDQRTCGPDPQSPGLVAGGDQIVQQMSRGTYVTVTLKTLLLRTDH